MWMSGLGQRALDLSQPARLNVERQDHCALGRCVLVGMVFPGVDQHCQIVGQRCELSSHPKSAVCATSLDQDVAMMMGVSHQRRIHVEQGDTTEAALENLDGRGHVK